MHMVSDGCGCNSASVKRRPDDTFSQCSRICRVVFESRIPVGGEQHREDQRAVPVLCLGDRDLYPADSIFCNIGAHDSKSRRRKKERESTGCAACLMALRSPSGSRNTCISLYGLLRDQLSQEILFRRGGDHYISIQRG